MLYPWPRTSQHKGIPGHQHSRQIRRDGSADGWRILSAASAILQVFYPARFCCCGSIPCHGIQGKDGKGIPNLAYPFKAKNKKQEKTLRSLAAQTWRWRSLNTVWLMSFGSWSTRLCWGRERRCSGVLNPSSTWSWSRLERSSQGMFCCITRSGGDWFHETENEWFP